VNGSGVKGLAQHVLDQFVAAGFKSAGPPADADRDDYVHTQVRYAPGKGSAGLTTFLATGPAHLGEALSARDTLGADVLVVIGRDWDKLQHKFTVAVRASPRSTAPGSPTTAATTTTTTRPNTVDTRFLPVDPKTGGPLVGCPS
jgi:hypothetical protein